MELTSASKEIIGESRVTIRLLELIRSTNYELVQENGQRRLTAPSFSDDSNDRAKGCEIFIGRLPRDCYEDEIMPMIQSVGKLLQLRLMLDFSGSTRGYAFALFENSTIARQACRVLDGYEIRPGHKIGVVKSIDNCRLFFGGVPKDKSKADFMEELGKILDGIINIYMYPNAQDRTQNRGFIFVEFRDHRSAAMARRKLVPGRVVLWNHEIAVDWADPEPGEPIDDDIMESVTALFVRNLSLDIPHQQIRQIFQKASGIPILKLKKINHFAFIHYENRQLAECVLETITKPGGIADRQEWEVTWAKPIDTWKTNEQRHSITSRTPDNIPEKSSNNLAKVSVLKNRYKKSQEKTQENRDGTSCNYVDYQAALESFVAENLNAVCRLECYPRLDQSGHVCKVTITTGSEILYIFEGKSFRSQQKAIKDTAREVYHRVRYAIKNEDSGIPYSNHHDSSNSSIHQPSLYKYEASR